MDDAIFMEKDGPTGPSGDDEIRFSDNMALYNRIITSTDLLKTHIEGVPGIDSSIISVLPNYIDTEKYRSKKNNTDSIPVIGWIGTPTNTIYLKDPLLALQKLHDLGREFKVMLCGADEGEARKWYSADIDFVQWSLEHEVGIYNRIDIGIMPLPDDVWTAGKAGYKLMLYMAMGKIAVASDVGQNSNIIQHGIDGFLVGGDIEWEHIFSRVLNEYRSLSYIGNRAREKIIVQYSLEGNGERFVGMFTSE